MSSPLVALLLVTSSSRGSHVVFQWPRRPKLVKRYSRMRYFAEEEELEDVRYTTVHYCRCVEFE